MNDNDTCMPIPGKETEKQNMYLLGEKQDRKSQCRGMSEDKSYSRFSPSTMWFPVIKQRLLGFAEDDFIH